MGLTQSLTHSNVKSYLAALAFLRLSNRKPSLGSSFWPSTNPPELFQKKNSRLNREPRHHFSSFVFLVFFFFFFLGGGFFGIYRWWGVYCFFSLFFSRIMGWGGVFFGWLSDPGLGVCFFFFSSPFVSCTVYASSTNDN